MSSSIILHNIYFMRGDGWDRRSAEAWLKTHNFKIKKKDPHILGDQIRYNQLPKTKFMPRSYVTKILPNGAHMIFGRLKINR